MKNNVLQSEFLTVADVKTYLRVSQSQAYALTHRKDFPICRFGTCIRIPRDAFLVWVEKHSHIPSELTA